MEYIVCIAIVAACIGGVLWNHRTKLAAFTGAGFEVPLPPDQVAAIVGAVYCQGARAAVRTTFCGVSVRRQGPLEFIFETKLGDIGWIRIAAARTGSTVVAETTSLHIGGTLLSEDGSPIWRLSKSLTDLLYKMLGLAPFAGRMKRFQNGLERKVGNQIHRQLQS